MARMRGAGGGAAYAVALVIFVIVAVFAVIMAIILYTQLSEQRLRAVDADKRLAQFIKPNEQSQPAIADAIQAARTSNASVVGQLQDDLRALKQKINGNPGATVQAINAEVGTLGIKEGQTLVGEIRRLSAEKQSADTLINQLKGEVKTAQDRLAAVEAEKGSAAQTFSSSVKEQQDKLAALGQQFQAYQQQVDQQRTGLEQRIQEIQGQSQKAVADARNQVQQKDEQISILTRRLNDLTRPSKPEGEGSAIDPTRQIDGQVVSVLSEENMVYVNLGQREHVLLGMTFEVFDRSTGVAPDQFGDFRGKATIEITNVGQNSSTARVVRLARNKTLMEGDVIANVVFDPNTTYKFFVYGEFDLDNTGQATVTDRRRVETMIQQWGGKLSEQLTYDTDFLVLGQEPKMPDPLPQDEIDPKKIAEYTAKRRIFETYQNLIAEAKSLSIPVLNQNRFLAMVGYYRR